MRITRSICALTLAALPLLPSAASAEDASSLGYVAPDGLDTRLAAKAISEAAAAVGYTAHTHLNGQTPTEAWNSMRDSQVVAWFAHSAPGYVTTKDNADPYQRQYIVSGATPMERVLPAPNTRAWLEYRPYLDVDDVKLAILAGCRTALKNEVSQDHFPEVGKHVGIDSLVTYRQDVFFPGGNTATSGNYYWQRAANYLANGQPIRRALDWARSDLQAKEGSAQGWGSYLITGTVTSPEEVRLTGTKAGQASTSNLLAALPIDLSPLAVPVSLTSGSLLVTEDPNGTVTRRDPSSGRVVDVLATPTKAGLVSFTDDALVQRASQFTSDLIGESVSSWASTSSEVSHVPGQDALMVEWRTAHRLITAEVDKRSGAVTYWNDAQAPTGTASQVGPEMTEHEAFQLASSVEPADVISLSTVREWGSTKFIFASRIASEAPGAEELKRLITVDATSGDVTISTT